jgi:hypothetical protein
METHADRPDRAPDDAKSRGRWVRSIIWGGLVAATIDIDAACLISRHPVGFILHTIAGGLLGKTAYAGGIPTAILGLVLQEAMGLMIAAIFGLAARRAPILTRFWIASGLAYGVVIFVVMNYVVVPLSGWHVVPHFKPVSFVENMLAMLLFGLIVAGFNRVFSRPR